MKNKDLLVVYNIYGQQNIDYLYDQNLSAILWHVKKNNLYENVRVVVSACLKDMKTLLYLKERYGELITIISIDESLPVQVTFNKSVLTTIETFQEQYEGYLYISADCCLQKLDDLFIRLISKIKSGEYGVIHLDVLDIVDFIVRGQRIKLSNEEDYPIQLGRWCDCIVACYHRSLKDFYGVPMPDAFAKSNMENTLGYVCSALRKKYILMGDSLCFHHAEQGSDSIMPKFNSRGLPYEKRLITPGLFWGRTIENSILSDKEAIEAGLGFLPGEILTHDITKYDNENLSIDENLKFGIKRCFYTNKTEVDYEKIQYELI